MTDHSTLPWIVITHAKDGWHSILITDTEEIPPGANFNIAATNVQIGWPKDLGITDAYNLDEHYQTQGKK